MISLVIGVPGTGKTLNVVHNHLIDYLKHSERDIYTNLPLNIDNLIRYIGLGPAKAQKYKDRIHILENRYSNAYIYENGERVLLERPELVDKKTGEIIRPADVYHEISEFWRFGSQGAVFIIDELSKFMSSLDWKSRSDELKGYIAEHRHYNHDIIFLTQKPAQIDKQVRDLVDHIYVAKRSTSELMIDTNWIKAKYPFLFFFLDEYQSDILSSSGLKLNPKLKLQRLVTFPTKAKYACYNSYSKEGSFSGMKEGRDLQGDDKAAANKNLRKALTDNFLGLSMLIIIPAVALWVFWQYYSAVTKPAKTQGYSGNHHHQQLVESAQQTNTNILEEVQAEIPEPQPTKEPITFHTVPNPGLTEEQTGQLFDGSLFHLGNNIVLFGTDEQAGILRSVQQDRQHYVRINLVRVRNRTGYRLNQDESIKVVWNNLGFDIIFNLELDYDQDDLQWELAAHIETAVKPNQPIEISQTRILREDQDTINDNGLTFTTDKFEEEIGLQFTFNPVRIDDTLQAASGRLVITDSNGDSVDDIQQSSLDTWATITSDPTLIGSIRQVVDLQTKARLVPGTGWVPFLRRLEKKSEFQEERILLVYAELFPTHPSPTKGRASKPEYMHLRAP